MIQTIIDQLDSELNLSPNPNLNYIREKVKELDQYASEQEYDASSKVEDMERELESVRDDLSDLEFKLDQLCGDIREVLDGDLSNEDKLTEIEDLLYDV